MVVVVVWISSDDGSNIMCYSLTERWKNWTTAYLFHKIVSEFKAPHC